MPIHDWTRVSAGTFHDFHCAWLIEIRNALNKGLLPSDHYALAEQIAGDFGPDVLTLQAAGGNGASGPSPPSSGPGNGSGTTVALAPPKVRFTATTDLDLYAQKQRTLVIRHSSEDRVVALIEIISPGNKASRHAWRAFVDKAASALSHGLHLLVIDLLPPGPRDPQGLHGAVWAEISNDPYQPPADKPLTLAAYAAGAKVTAYVEPVALADVLPEMPLFLTAEQYVNVPLEATYRAAGEGFPQRWRTVLEA